MANKFVTLGIIIIASFLVSSIVIAVTNWNQSINWIGTDTNFTIWDAPTEGNTIPSEGSVPLGVAPEDPYDIIYYIQNDGNVNIQVTGTATTSDADTAWAPTNPITVATGSRVAITLTLSNLNVNGGSVSVTFSSAKAP